jgi:superfamily II DNA or RNA helicase
MRGTVDIVMLQTLARRPDLAELTAGYGFVVVDECHHIPAAAFENAVRQVPRSAADGRIWTHATVLSQVNVSR